MVKNPLTILLLLSIPLCSYSQSATLSGIVTSSDQDYGLQGVNIVLKSTGYGTVSGLHGEYRLKEIPEGKQVVIFSFMGYETVERELELAEGKAYEIAVEMVPGSIELSAVAVEARRPFSAASSKAIRDFDLKVKPVRSAQDMLQLVPGLVIAQHAGGGKDTLARDCGGC